MYDISQLAHTSNMEQRDHWLSILLKTPDPSRDGFGYSITINLIRIRPI